MDFGYRITPIFFYSKWDKDKDFQSESVIALYMTRCGSVMVSTVWTLTTAGATLRRVTLSRGQMTSGSSLSSSSASSSKSSLPSASSPWTLSSLSRLALLCFNCFLQRHLQILLHLPAKTWSSQFSSFARSGNTSRNWRRNWGHENHLWPSTLGQVRPSWPHLGDQDHHHQLTWRYQEPEQPEPDLVMRCASLRVNQRPDEAARSWREYTPASESSNSGRTLQAVPFIVKIFICFQMFWLDLLSYMIDIFIFC